MAEDGAVVSGNWQGTAGANRTRAGNCADNAGWKPAAVLIRSFQRIVLAGWVLLSAAAAYYANLKAIPAKIALPLAVAFLIEYPFFLMPGFPEARDAFFARGRARGAFTLFLSALVPWLVYALPTGHFNFPALTLLACVAVVMCFWYVFYPPNAGVDALYLCMFGGLLLFKVLAKIYPAPYQKLDISVLGHVMLIRVMATAMLSLRGTDEAEYRFWPNMREWLAGLRWFVYLLPAVSLVYWGLGLAVLRPHFYNPLQSTGTFFGILWITALPEEFIFRGLLQNWFERWSGNSVVALVVTSLIFGSVHLGFHGQFPNWKFSIVAAVLGLFCGLARRRTGGIQAGMVAHALAVTVWKSFLQ